MKMGDPLTAPWVISLVMALSAMLPGGTKAESSAWKSWERTDPAADAGVMGAK